VCRIPEPWNKPANHNSNTGFPVFLNRLPSQGEINVVVVPVNWVDFSTTETSLEEQFGEVRKFADFYEAVSKQALTFQIEYVDRWLTVPGSINDYSQDRPSDFNYKLVQAAADTADSLVDFSGTDILIVIIPDNAPVPLQGSVVLTGDGRPMHASFQQNATDKFLVTTDEGGITNWMGAGAYFDYQPEKNEWSYYVHEAGHMFELPDYYVIGEDKWLYSPWPDVEPKKVPNGPFNNWSIMGNQDGPSRTMESWSRWLVGWLSEDEIACYDARNPPSTSQFDVSLTPLDIYTGGTKTVIVRTGDSTGFVIESRRPIGPDESLSIWKTNSGVDPQGVVIYRVDTRYKTVEGPLSIVPPDGHFLESWSWVNTQPPGQLDALYHGGDTTSIEGVGIKVRHVGGDADIVRLSFGAGN
jgi:M6 family metalloprotease-like protein